MKKIISVLVFVLVSSVVGFSQGVLKNKKITADEIPSAVAASFKKDFPSATGTWTIFFTQELSGTSAVLTPKWYLFALNGDNKSIAQYSPNGKLEKTKGMDEAITKQGGASSSKGNK